MFLCCVVLSVLPACDAPHRKADPREVRQIPPGPWFQPEEYLWVLQKVDTGARKGMSTPWRTTVTDGRTKDIVLDWKDLTDRTEWKRASIQISRAADVEPFFGREFTHAGEPAVLPPLPRGGYWLTVKTFGDGLTGFYRLYLNVLESPLAGNDLPDAPLASLRARGGQDGNVVVSGWNPSVGEASLRVKVGTVEGDAVSEKNVPLPTGGKEVTIPVDEAQPGRTLVVGVELTKDGRVLDRTETWLAVPGDYPAAPQWPTDAPPQNVFDYPAGETVSSAAPFQEQRTGLDEQLRTMAERGSGTVQLWLQWGKIEPLGGARDWSNLDAYVAYLTERKIPFTLASIGSVLFGNGPERVWGEWAMNDRGEYALWRKLPMTSPTSPTYHREAPEFVRAVIERYKGNPYLAGYVTLNQGLDSGIFQDQHETLMDYSASARESFRGFLRQRYGTLDKLNAAWGVEWKHWDDILPPRPELEREVNLTPAWKDWTAWKLQTYRAVSVELFEPLFAELDPARPVVHYTAKTGPFEYLFPGLKVRQWATADGAGEDYRMGRINGITKNWGLWRQTESHEVPPANLRYMMDMWAAALRNGGGLIRFNLVFNSQPRHFLTVYPQNEALKKTMEWWGSTAALRDKLASSTTTPPETGVVLSWADQLYRNRVWRWYTLPGDRADAMTREQGFLPVKWLTEWTPDAAWQGLRRVLVPQDARVWDPALREKLARFVREGGHLILWGRAGQFAADTGTDTFAGLRDLGAPELTVIPLPNAPLRTVQYGGERFSVAPAVSVAGAPAGARITADGENRPVVVEWPLEKGRVTWCLSETDDESERLVAAVLKQDGTPREVITTDARVDGFMVVQDGTRYVILNRYLGFGKKAADVPANTTVKLPALTGGGEWLVRRLVPAAEEQRFTTEQLATTGWKAQLLPSEMQVYEIVPAPAGQ
jgi:Beta-galactosidase